MMNESYKHSADVTMNDPRVLCSYPYHRGRQALVGILPCFASDSAQTAWFPVGTCPDPRRQVVKLALDACVVQVDQKVSAFLGLLVVPAHLGRVHRGGRTALKNPG